MRERGGKEQKNKYERKNGRRRAKRSNARGGGGGGAARADRGITANRLAFREAGAETISEGVQGRHRREQLRGKEERNEGRRNGQKPRSG